MAKLHLIQCGVGSFGSVWMKDVVPRSADFELAAIVDPSGQALAKAGALSGLDPSRQFSTLEEALEQVAADAVLTVTPPPVHVQHARLAFAKGLHLITEKPIADTFEHAREMVRLAADAGRQLVVSQNYRYKPSVALLAGMLREKVLGDLGHGHIDFYIPADFPGTFRQTMEFPLLVDMCIHHFDLLRAITGKDVVRLTVLSFRPTWAWYEHDPGLKMLIEMQDGIVFSYSGDWTAKGQCTQWDGNWRLQCADGALLWSDARVAVTRCETWGKNLSISYPDLPAMELQGQHATLHSFAEAIRTGSPAPTSGQDNLNSFGAVIAAMRSATEGRAVNVSELVDA